MQGIRVYTGRGNLKERLGPAEKRGAENCRHTRNTIIPNGNVKSIGFPFTQQRKEVCPAYSFH